MYWVHKLQIGGMQFKAYRVKCPKTSDLHCRWESFWSHTMAPQYILYFTLALPFVLHLVNTPTPLYNKELTVRRWASQVLILLKMKNCTFLSAMYNASASFANLSLMCGSWRPRPSAAKRLSKGIVYPCGRDENKCSEFESDCNWNHLNLFCLKSFGLLV